MADISGADWSRLQNLPAIAIEHLQYWSLAVRTQAARAVDSGQSDMARTIDAFLFAQALRQVLRAADLLASTLSDEAESGKAKDAIGKFRSAIPDAVHVRDVLDHFDDYARGIGNLAHRGTSRRGDRMPSEEAARMFEPWIKIEGEEISIHCGDRYIDIEAASKVTSSLVSELFDCIGFVESTFEAAIQSLGSLDRSNPAVVAFLFFSFLVQENLTPELVEELRTMVTPMSVSKWSDFSRARTLVGGYGLATHAEINGDRAYMKLVPEAEEVRVATRGILVTNALWITMRRIPRGSGDWLIHSIGRR